ncbi:hypothetical protein L9F63_015142, partial [Diploptera punctata]
KMAFCIKHVDSGLVLDVKGADKKSGTEIVLWGYNGQENQLWEYKNEMVDVFQTFGSACPHSLHCGSSVRLNLRNTLLLVLDISGGNHGAPVITFKGHGGGNQKWYFEDDFTIRNGTGMVMDVEHGAAAPGTRIIGYPKHGAPNQKFRIVPFNRK